MSEHFAFCRLPNSVGTEGKPQLRDGWRATFVCLPACTQASTLVHLRTHAKMGCARACVRECVCVCVGEGEEEEEEVVGSKSAVIQALLSLLNDDVNL